MTRRVLLLAASAIVATTASAPAAPLSPAALSQLVPGGEFRGYFSRGANFENHIWRFAPDGTVRAVYTLDRFTSFGNLREEGGDQGRWSIRGDRLCIEWTRILPPACYVVDAGTPPQVRLIGPPVIEGSFSR